MPWKYQLIVKSVAWLLVVSQNHWEGFEEDQVVDQWENIPVLLPYSKAAPLNHVTANKENIN